jgi:epoxyqueuosine reductase QueG
MMIAKKIQDEGEGAVVPSLDPRMLTYAKPSGELPGYTSNWSERHVAYAAGLGTFSLSGGLITRRGTAGRFMSIITSLELSPTMRPYNELYEYCSDCGACITACPPKAISHGHLKNNSACGAWLDKIRELKAPYYGCGKCQCGMPCENGIPGNLNSDR